MAKPKLNWLHKRKKTEPELPYESPLWLGPISNGEFFAPQTERDRRMRAEILRRCDDNARRVGMDRREFIASAMGMATALSVINLASGCGDEAGLMGDNASINHIGDRAAGPTAAGSGAMGGAAGAGVAPSSPMDSSSTPTRGNTPPMTGTPNGGMCVSQATMMDNELASELFGGDYFILDFQTHHTADGVPGPVFDDCMGADCTSPNTYIQKIFEMSDTTVAVLSGLPSTIGPNGDVSDFSNEEMQASRDRVNRAAQAAPFGPYAERMVAHCQIMPVENPGPNAELMMKAKTRDTRGWKCYPPTEGGWFLHEHPEFIETARMLDEKLVCVHKGFPFEGWSRVHADPGPDVGRIALMFPDVSFVIYHSAFDSGHMEGPYDPNPDPQDGGTDRLSKVVKDNNLMGKNVYAEMGSTWNMLMRDMMAAQHYLGKMLTHLGPDRIVWGSECVWFGCPQPQIEMMKAFKMDPDFAAMYGYPDYTDEIRRKVFGYNGAPLYRLDPCATRLKVDRDKVANAKAELDMEVGPRRWTLGRNRPLIATRRDFINLWRHRKAHGQQA
jgi:predicted TIM-barrel fold metal-dependent hydrolase